MSGGKAKLIRRYSKMLLKEKLTNRLYRIMKRNYTSFTERDKVRATIEMKHKLTWYVNKI